MFCLRCLISIDEGKFTLHYLVEAIWDSLSVEANLCESMYKNYVKENGKEYPMMIGKQLFRCFVLFCFFMIFFITFYFVNQHQVKICQWNNGFIY